MTIPLISVVIATYNRSAMMTRAINSVLAQTISQSVEIVLAIERDDTASLNALEALADERVRYVVNPVRRGPGPARDAAALASKGRWIAFLDDDDEWLPSKLEQQIAGSPGPTTISMTLSHFVTPAGTFIRPTDPYNGEEPIDEWLFGRRSWFKSGQSMLQTSSLMVPRELFTHLQFGDSRHEEWELVIRAVKQFGFRLVTIREPLVIYYTGHTYPWRRSVEWIETMKDVVTPRAYSGFCLTAATQGIDVPDRNRAFFTFLQMARRGRPTLRQWFAFIVIWLLPDRHRHKVQARITGALNHRLHSVHKRISKRNNNTC